MKHNIENKLSTLILVSLFLLVSTLFSVNAAISPISPSLNLDGQNRFTIQNYINITDVDRINEVMYVQRNNGSDIQAKINLCPTTGCDIIIPRGTYDINAPINVSDHPDMSLTFAEGARLTTNDNISVLLCDSQTHRVNIINAHITQTNGIQGIGIYWKQCLYSEIRNIYIENFTTGMYFPNPSYYHSIINPVLYYNDVGINIEANANNFYGGRIYPPNTETGIGIKISGNSNDFFGGAIERVAGKTNSTGLIISGNYNYFTSLDMESLITGINVSGSLNVFTSISMSSGFTNYINDTGGRNSFFGIRRNDDSNGWWTSFDDATLVNSQLGSSLNADSNDIINVKDLYAVQIYNLAAIKGRSTGDFSIVGGTSSRNIFIQVRNSTGDLLTRLQFYGGDSGIIKLVSGYFHLNNNNITSVDRITTDSIDITSPPVDCPAGSYITRFLGLTSTCTAITEIPNDLDVTGNFTGNIYYAEMWVQNESGFSTTTIGSSNVWYNITGFNDPDMVTGQTLNGFTYDNTFEYLTATIAGKYKVMYSVSTGNAGNNQEYEFAVAINNIIQNNTVTHRKIQTAGDVGDISGSGFIDILVDDNIYLMITNKDGTADIQVHAMNLNLMRIGS